MDYRRFRRQLRASGEYRTPDGAALLPAGIAAGTIYYSGLLYTVFTGSRLAVRGVYTDAVWARESFATLRAAEAAGGRIHITGARHMGEVRGPVVIVSNHMSLVDAMFLPGIVLTHKPVSFVVKQSLLDYPFFGHIMRAVQPIAVGRTNPRDDLRIVLSRGRELLASGRSIIVFPQATRDHVFDPSRFNTLGVKLALKAGVPVVPLALKTDFQGNGRWFKDAGPIFADRPIRFAFGPPIQPMRKGQRTHETVVRFIADHVTAWGGHVRASVGETPAD